MNVKYIYSYLYVIFALLPFQIMAADEAYKASDIPEDLKKDAYAVLRTGVSEFVQSDQNNGKYKERRVLTILDEKGARFANYSYTCDKFTELTSFSGVIYDAQGKIVKKIKKGDLTQSSIDVQSFASDSYVVFYECTRPVYPFTVEYNFEVKYKNGIIAYPGFSPYFGFHFSVEKAEYKIEIAENIQPRIRNAGGFELKKESVQGKVIYSASAENLKAVKHEPDYPSSRDLFPSIYIAPSDFCYDSACGSMADWKSYGLWVSGLLKGRDDLQPDVAAKMKELTANAKTEREKVEILYDFLQKNSRYVSIQLGIGGFQPIEAGSVYKNRFGDCKGLSNLMKAMLKSVGIESNYCEIAMNRDDILFPDFANVFQTNHAILFVPLKNDSIWLECTTQTSPFGFVHRGIAGHDALIVSDDGGKLQKLPSFSEDQNLTSSRLTMNIDENGNVAGNMNIEKHLFNYDNVIDILRNRDREKVVQYVNGTTNLPKMELGEYTVTENKTSLPSVVFEAQFKAPGFANKTGARLFVPVCPLSKTNYNKYSAQERFLDIEIKSGYTEQDSIVFNTPEGFVVESLPKDVDEKSKYGTISAHAEMKGNSIVYTQNVVIHKGVFAKDEYKDIKDFYQKISAVFKRKIVLKKE